MLWRWEKLNARASGRGRTFVDLVLCGLYKSLGREKKWQEAAARLKNEPAGNRVLPMDGEIGQAIVALRGQIQALLERRWP